MKTFSGIVLLIVGIFLAYVLIVEAFDPVLRFIMIFSVGSIAYATARHFHGPDFTGDAGRRHDDKLP